MLTRQDFYDLIWSEPAKTIAPRFGISDVALSKLCERHGIPQPPRGYWAKIASGKKVARFSLPPRGIGIRELIKPGRQDHWSYYETPAGLAEMDIPPPLVFPESAEDLTARVRALVGKVTLPRDLTRAHAAIQALLDADEARVAGQRAKGYYSAFDDPLFDSPFERRRLRLMNALMLAFAKLGGKPSLSRQQDPNVFTVTVGHQHVSITVDETGYQRSGWRSERDRLKPATTKLTVTLSANAGGMKNVWEDDKDARVEDHVTEIVVAAFVAGELSYRQQEQGHHEWLVKRKAQILEDRRKAAEEKERKERERLAALEKARIDRLLADAGRHRQAVDIRAYAAVVEAAPHLFQGDADKRAQWLAWARTQADALDPVVTGDIGDIF